MSETTPGTPHPQGPPQPGAAARIFNATMEFASDGFADERRRGSPLTLLTRNPRLASFIEGLRRFKEELAGARAAGRSPPDPLRLSFDEVVAAREAFDEAVRRGETRLYGLAWLLSIPLLGTDRIDLRYHLFCRPARQMAGRRMLIVEPIDAAEIGRESDLSLASRIAARYRYDPDGKGHQWLDALAGLVEFQPLESTQWSLALKLTTRVKAEEEIFRKLTDEIFEIDRLMARDKQLSPFSKYVKDTFGMKIIAHDKSTCYRIEERLGRMRLDPTLLSRHGLELPDFDPSHENTRWLVLMESKDYIGCAPHLKKKTGWEAIKNVYAWAGEVIEIQIQTEANYELELNHLSGTSHVTFSEKRRELRRRLAEEIPLYGDFQALLRWLVGPFALGQEQEVPEALRKWIRVEA